MGVDAFIVHMSATIQRLMQAGASSDRALLVLGEYYANICLRDATRPAQFLKQMAGAPPVGFGIEGFRTDLVDDQNPARHYIAFVFVGYWLPALFAVAVLWMWEMAGFVRYRGHWSQNDIRSGYVGIRHGRLLRK
ncbi:MAG: hypothetical protein HC802_19980, partial [Caldilineaceae bacterium]|nr:hypothetical protein [Caldilineaceae bacterium]